MEDMVKDLTARLKASEDRHAHRDKKVKLMEAELLRPIPRELAQPISLLDSASGLVVGTFQCDNYWPKFVDMHTGAFLAAHKTHKTYAHQAGMMQFGPTEVFSRLFNMFGGASKQRYIPPEFCGHPVIECFALIFAAGHALPKVRERLQAHIQCHNEQILSRLEFIAEGKCFDKTYGTITRAVDNFLAGEGTPTDVFEKIQFSLQVFSAKARLFGVLGS